MSKLDKKTLKWAAKQIEKWAGECATLSKPRYYWDANFVPSRGEMAGRKLMLKSLAKEIKRGGK